MVSGVRTVVYAAGTKPKGQWTLAPNPLLRITGDDGVEILDIAALARLSDGSVVIASNKTTDLRFFAANGAHLRNVGRQGRGPGEFDGLWGLFRIRDTLIASDGIETLQVFSPDGKYLRTEARPIRGPKGERVNRGGFFADGRSLLKMAPARDTSGPTRRMMHFTLHLKVGSVTTFVGKFPSYQRVKMSGTPNTNAVFGAAGYVAVLPNHFCVGFSDAMALSCYTPEGMQISRVQRPGALGRTVNTADKQAYIDAMDVANPGPRGETLRRLVREATTYAERMPAFGRLVGSTTDEVWVGPNLTEDVTLAISPVPDRATVWSVFSVNGDWLSDVTLPKRFRLMEAGANYVAGIQKDDDDVESVVVYSIVKR